MARLKYFNNGTFEDKAPEVEELTNHLNDTVAHVTQLEKDAWNNMSGDWVDITNKPETFPPSTHSHVKLDITDLSLAWTDITGKPTEFTPSTHTHTKSQITDLSLAWDDITGKPSTFAPSAHTHTKANITDFPASLPANGGDADTVDGLHASSFATSGHTHSGYLATSGGTLTGIVTANSNTSYGTKQIRNIIIATTDPVLANMANGDIWIKV